MRYPTIDLALVGRLLRRRWHVLVALALLGAMLGFGLSFVIAPGYISTSKVLLQGNRPKDQLPGESEVATSSIVLDRAADALRWGGTGRDLRDRVSAAVDTNVIEISGAAETPERARQLTEQVTTQYVDFSQEIAAAGAAPPPAQSRAELQRQVDDSTNKLEQLRRSPSADSPGADGRRIREDIDRAQLDVTRASAQLNQLDAQADGGSGGNTANRITASVIEPATLPTGPASPSMIEIIALGALVLAAAGVFWHLLRLRVDARLWEPDDVGAALGTPVLGCVEVPSPRSAATSGVRQLLRDDRRWVQSGAAPIESAATRQARCRRVLAHLRAERETPTGPLDVLLVTVEGDAAALAAVTELVVAGTADGPVRLVADHVPDLGDSVLQEARRRDAEGLVSTVPGHTCGEPGTTFEVLTLTPAHPLVPDSGPSVAVVAVTAGTLNGLELATLATACADAGRRPAGAVLVHPRGSDGTPPAPSVPVDASASDTARLEAAS